MTWRNDLDAAHARIESLERETRELAEQNERLAERLRAAGQLPPELPRIAKVVPPAAPEAKPWPLMRPAPTKPKHRDSQRREEWRRVMQLLGDLFSGWMW